VDAGADEKKPSASGLNIQPYATPKDMDFGTEKKD